MSKKLNIGVIGLDTSHVKAFTELLNDENHKYHVSGGKVIVAYPGGSADFELSYSRIPEFTNLLQEEYKVKIVTTIEELAEQCDAILLESVDGRVHLEQFKKLAPFRKPVFIDKPFALRSKDAIEIMRIAEHYEFPVMSCSALRYAEGLTQALVNENVAIIGADCYGPMPIEPTQPGLYWYGIHTVDMLYSILGMGCVKVTTITNEDHDLVIGEWADGRIGTIRGNRVGNSNFGALIHHDRGTQFVDISAYRKPYNASLLENIMHMFHTGKKQIDLRETCEIIRFIEAANESSVTRQTVVL
jgi:predicted dehydrogenase